jgi:DNA polymerase-3 subunit chi
VAARCQVDFYLMGAPALDPQRLACKLATMAWERGHEVSIVTAGDAAAAQLDGLLWEYPAGRFVPHARTNAGDAPQAPVTILTGPPRDAADVVINLTPSPLPEPGACRRLLEIVPFDKGERAASRHKYRAYRRLGLNPSTHEIN